MAHRKPRRSVAEWQAIFEDFSQAGLSIDAFCKDRQIAKSTFSKWRIRLEDAGGSATEQPAFVQAVASPTLSEESVCESIALSLPGCKIQIPATLSESQLRVLLDAVLTR